jgi:2-C-methyl-D-erythritol 2,4-cyclodiphosphate synthase
MRIGHGYDAHRLKKGRKLILGGVEIPWSRGLDGHSDADVLLHALADAMLGAAALGDIGHMFPDTIPETEGMSSLAILRQVDEAVVDAGYSVENCDCTVVAQEPKLAPFIAQIRSNIALALNIETSAVSVKATTEEQMGFTGSGEGICAHAVVLLR